MKRLETLLSTLVLSSLLFSLAVTAKSSDIATAQTSVSTATETPSKLRSSSSARLSFEENQGQTDRAAKFISRANGFTAFFAEEEVAFQLKTPKANVTDSVRLKFAGANAKTNVTGENETITKTNYYIDRNRLENIANFGSVKYEELYAGIDAVFYGNAANQLEYDFNVEPNADPSQIKLEFNGAESLSLDEAGNLVIKTANSELVQKKPFAYQIIGGENHEIKSKYVVTEQSQITFALGEYDRNLPLVIDPAVDYLTYLGGSASDIAHNIATDSQGNSYIVGTTLSLNFPTGNAGTRTDFAVSITKLSPDGATVIYNTFLDGSENDGFADFDEGFIGNDIAVDASGNAYVAGQTDSPDFPVTDNAYQRTRLCSRQFGQCIFPEEAFAAKLNPQGTIVYATYVGGRNTDFANGIAVDSAGKAYITGGTLSGLTFPKKNEFQGTGVFSLTDSADAFLTVLNSAGSDIVYSSGLGGELPDSANAIAIDAANNVYITGFTDSTDDFPVKNAFQNVNRGGRDAFVAKFNPAASGAASLIYSTMIGGAGTDIGNGIAVNSGGQAHVVGVTGSFNFPLQNAIRTTNQINEAFVTVFSSTGGSLINSTFLGGSDKETANAVALDPTGSIYVLGNTTSNDFPIALPFQATLAGDRDAFVTKLKFGRGVISSSYLGGTGFDSGTGITVRGNQIFVAGKTSSTNLETTNGVLQTAFGGVTDGFVAKILDTKLDAVGVFRPTSLFQITQSINTITTQTLPFTGPIAGARGVSGDFDGDGIDTTGSFTNGAWKVRNANFPIGNAAAFAFNFGLTGDLPIVGDWDGDGIDTAGAFRQSTGQFFLTNTANAQAINATITFGLNGDLPVAGDWNGDGIDSVGVFRPSTGQFFLTDENIANPNINQAFLFGSNGDLPTAGDWNGNGVDTIGVWRPLTAQFFLTNDNINISNQFVFGQINTDQPLAGDWDGRPTQ